MINTKVSIDRDNSIGDFVSIAPNATTGGNGGVGIRQMIDVISVNIDVASYSHSYPLF